MPVTNKICEQCGNDFLGHGSNARFCDRCKVDRIRKRHTVYMRTYKKDKA
jgi:hypothetical protein